MADETTITSGVDDQTVEISGMENIDREDDTEVSDLIRKIEELEHEKLELAGQNYDVRERIKGLEEEMEGLKSEMAEMGREMEESEDDKKALEAVAARAVELETEVSRLQHDLISSMTEGEEVNVELSELKRVFGELKASDSEKGVKVEKLEREKEVLTKRIEREVKESKELKAESENQIRELEKKIEAVKGQAKSKIDEKESEIYGLKKGIEELKSKNCLELEKVKKEKKEVEVVIDEKESEIYGLKKGIEELKSKNCLELETVKKEKKEMEVLKSGLEEALRKSAERAKEMELKMNGVQQELEESREMIRGLKERMSGSINGIAVVKKSIVEDGERGLKLQWPVAVASTGTIAAAAVVFYLRYGRRR